ncbi:MAG: hypothetical protein LIO54_07060 [Oscillospiraceae bacterium]|nr:hypothetical protein [Oscillospiraceae bacterium]
MSMEQQFAKTAYWNCLSWGVLSSMSVTICTIVDAALIGNFVSDNGLAVVGIATPVFMLFAFFGVTVAVGANVLIGQALGAGDRRNANLLMGKQLFIGILLGLLLLVGSLCFQNRVITFWARKIRFSSWQRLTCCRYLSHRRFLSCTISFPCPSGQTGIPDLQP